MRKLATFSLIAVLLTASLSQMACGNATTLARVGAGFQQAAAGFRGEVNSLAAGGLLSPEKAERLRQKARGFQNAADALAAYLNSLPGITSGNKAEVLGKIAEATGTVRALLQNPDLLGLPQDALVVKILNFADITLSQAAIVIAAIQVKPGAVMSATQSETAVPLASIKVKLAPVPKGAEKYFTK